MRGGATHPSYSIRGDVLRLLPVKKLSCNMRYAAGHMCVCAQLRRLRAQELTCCEHRRRHCRCQGFVFRVRRCVSAPTAPLFFNCSSLRAVPLCFPVLKGSLWGFVFGAAQACLWSCGCGPWSCPSFANIFLTRFRRCVSVPTAPLFVHFLSVSARCAAVFPGFLRSALGPCFWRCLGS